MTSNELLEYIKDQRAKGISDVAIKASLAGNGWTVDDVDEAYGTLSGPIKKKKNIFYIFLLVVLALFLLVQVFSFVMDTFITPINKDTVYQQRNSIVISNPRLIEIISQESIDVEKLVARGQLHGDPVKTKDGRFWFFSLAKEGSSGFYSFRGYLLDTQEKKLFDTNIEDSYNLVVPLYDSVVAVRGYNGATRNQILIYDAASGATLKEVSSLDDIQTSQ